MRVLILASEFPPGPGGIGTHAHQVATQLAGLGWQVVVLAPQDYSKDEEIAAFNGSQPFRVVRQRHAPGAPVEALLRQAALSRAIVREQPQVLIASGSRSVMLAASRWRGRGLPWVAVGHGTEFGTRRGWERRATRWGFDRASAVVCVSDYTRHRMHEAGIHPRRVLVVPNGADPGRFHRLSAVDAVALRTRLGLKSESRLLVTVGNVTDRKGQDVVVRALPEILKRFPTVHYLVAGLPTQGVELAALAEQLGVAPHVHLLGRVDDRLLLSVLNDAEVFIMTSRSTAEGDVEGFGIAVVEAALCGLPAVVSSGCGLTEAIIEGETGLAVPQGDAGATAKAIASLLENDSRRRDMGDAARRHAETDQTWGRRIRLYDELLRGLVALPGQSVESIVERAAS